MRTNRRPISALKHARPWPHAYGRLATRCALTLLPFALLGGCGKAGNPLPPLRLTPQAPTELRLAQRGERIEISGRAPRVSVDGARLGVLDVQLFVTTGEGDPLKTVAPRERRLAPGEAFTETLQPLPVPGTALRVVARARMKRRMSAPTPFMTLAVQAAPPPVAKVIVERTDAGVRIGWKQGRQAAADARRYWVYRRAEDGVYVAPLNSEPTATLTMEDSSAEANGAVCYVVRAVAAIDPIVESADSEERCLTVRPPIPPATPGGLLAVPTGGDVDLSWSCAAEARIVGYRVYRATGDADAERRGETKAGQCSFRDENVPTDATLKYSLTSIDGDGHESTAAVFAPVRVRAH
jgi:hypothetical protein